MKENQRKDLTKVRNRIKEKRQNYISYNFSPLKNDILKTFFDLAQEYDDVQDFYRVCVLILHETLGVKTSLYLKAPVTKQLEMVCDTSFGIYSPPAVPPEYVSLSDKTYQENDSFLVPIYCKGGVNENEPVDDDEYTVLGVLEVSPCSKLTDSDRFFLTKFTNRIGYNLRKKMLGQQKITHLNFINNLVSDIEHNVIIPNMYFNHLFKQLQKRISGVSELKELVLEGKSTQQVNSDLCDEVFGKIEKIQEDLQGAYKEIENHHANCTLFLESLFRRDHFKKGYIVLRDKLINVDREIIEPQLRHYERRLRARDIEIKKPHDLREENYSIKADLGLLAQVYSNFFSNAVKYTESIVDHHGQPSKIMAYGRKIIPDYYGAHKPAIKLNVFTTGTHLSEDESKKIFIDGFQGTKSVDSSGQGHGLAFVKYIVELHGGTVGYTPTDQGNNFFFILPLENS